MKNHVLILLFACLAAWACGKKDFITSADAKLRYPADIVSFDTVFTTRGSVTQSFTIVNENDQPLQLSSIRLMGGATSAFSINVNGSAGASFSNLTVRANDSIYVFVKVTIDPNSSQQPFLVRDSILLAYNGNSKYVQLQAYGQNARFINGGRISTNSTWNNQLPYVILRPLLVDAGATLSIEPGTKIYFNANAPLIVNGTLKANGGVAEADRIVFRSERLDADFKDLPGTWPGLIFTNNSLQNELRYCSILNAYQGIVAQGNADAVPAKMRLLGCIIDNCYDVGLYAINTSVLAQNCLITQVGNEAQPGAGGSNVLIAGGGSYQFTHCTMATYANFFQTHKQPVLYAGNAANGGSLPLQLYLDNCIVHGQGGLPENEIVTAKTGNASFVVNLRHVLFKAKTDPANSSFTSVIRNADPVFDTINVSRRLFNWRLRETSPARNTGSNTGPATDLEGRPRPSGPAADLGAYEYQQ